MKRLIFLLAALLSMNSLAWSADEGKTKDSYLQKAESELHSLSAKVDALQKRSESVGHETRVELDRELKVVREKMDLAHRKLSDLKGSSEGTWKQLRRGADETLREVKRAYAKAAAHFNRGDHKKDKP